MYSVKDFNKIQENSKIPRVFKGVKSLPFEIKVELAS